MTAAAIAAAEPAAGPLSLDAALGQIAARAAGLDRAPAFPSENFGALRAAGVTRGAADGDRCSLDREIALVRAVARADASTARILDGHLNGVERLALSAAPELRSPELAAVARGELLLGVWGADPGPGEGPPARIRSGARGEPVLRGVKTFCSGAGGVQRALVVARDDAGVRRLAYLDTATAALRIDRDWYRAGGLRASESHRVEFCDAPVLAILGGEDELLREPFFSRDAIRSAALWAGLADAIVDATLVALSGRAPDELRLHTLGRMRVAHATIDRWLSHAAAGLGDQGAPGPGDPRALAGEARVAIAEAARAISDGAAEAGGSRALAGGGDLDRARRDLDLFLLQHRLGPKLVELGRGAIAQARDD